jgi:8-oxo-dGTP pyrophosphatase MutT (NUDIX family)
VEVDRPGPGEELNLGEVTKPRLAASVIVLRDSGEGPEVLLVQRNPEARFMGGAWVFPGGAVHEDDGGPAGSGVRETEEEAGVLLDPDALLPFSRWITPAQVKIRFDTWFFVAEAPDGAKAKCDGEECVAAIWMRPADALASYQAGDMLLVFPTIKHLEELAAFGSVAEALEGARSREVEPIEPRVTVDEDGAKVLLPGEPGYDEAAASWRS